MKSAGPAGWVNPRSRFLEPPGKPVFHDVPERKKKTELPADQGAVPMATPVLNTRRSTP